MFYLLACSYINHHKVEQLIGFAYIYQHILVSEYTGNNIYLYQHIHLSAHTFISINLYQNIL